MRWPWKRRDPAPDADEAPAPGGDARAWTQADPPFWLTGSDPEGPPIVGATEALGVSAFYRGMTLLSNTLGSLPLNTVSEATPGVIKPVASVFDQPEGPYGRTKFEWVQTSVLWLGLHGDVFYRHRWTGAGTLYALEIIPAHCVQVTWGRPAGETQENGGTAPPVGGKWFRITYTWGPFQGRQEVVDAREMTQISLLSLDGLHGMSVLTLARRGLSTAISGDKAADHAFRTGARVAGILSPEDDLEDDELALAKREIYNAITGAERSGSVPLVNRKLIFSPWMMSAADSQFLQQRQFSVEEMARWTGVPPHLLMQTAGATSWGSGLAEQNEALSRYTLDGWTQLLTGRWSRLLARPRRVEMPFTELTRPTYADMVTLMVAATGQPVMSVDEGRAKLHLPPVPGGATLTVAAAAAPDTDPDKDPDTDPDNADDQDEEDEDA